PPMRRSTSIPAWEASGSISDVSAAMAGSTPASHSSQARPAARAGVIGSGPPERGQAGDARFQSGFIGQGQHGHAAGRHAAEIAGLAGGEQRDQLLEAGVVADHQQAGALAVVIGDLDQPAGGGVVDALLLAALHVAQAGHYRLAGFPGAA